MLMTKGRGNNNHERALFIEEDEFLKHLQRVSRLGMYRWIRANHEVIDARMREILGTSMPRETANHLGDCDA